MQRVIDDLRNIRDELEETGVDDRVIVLLNSKIKELEKKKKELERMVNKIKGVEK